MGLSREVAEELLSQLAKSEIEIKSLFPKVIDRAYWRSLCPEMGILDPHSSVDLTGCPLSVTEEARAIADFTKHGYFQLPAA